nr:hypothetical protein HK105_007863 [Polyrhizophydium stewartii]
MTSRPPSAAVSVPPPAAGAPRQAPPQASGAAPATAPRPDQAALDAVHQAYLASLAELTFNSKPIITNLTIIAHESIHAAPAVARAIEDHLRRVRAPHCRPCAPPPLPAAQRSGLRHADPIPTPTSLLTQADARHVIPAMYLMDSILKNVGGVYRSCFARNIVAVFKAAYAAVPPQDKARLQKLVGTWKTFTTTIFPPPTIAALERLFPQTPGSSNLARPDAGEALPGMFPGPGMLPPGFQPSAASAAAAAAALLANPLALQSIIEQAGVSYPGVPDDLTRFHPSAVFALYEAMPLQCKQCGLRFPKAFDGGSRMDAHLDWHFRQNKRALERGKRTLSRDWYVPEADWIVERDIDVSDKQAVSALFGGEPEASADDDKKGQPVPVLPATEETQRCSVCFEAFEKFFDEEEEIWMIRGAVQSGDQVGTAIRAGGVVCRAQRSSR